MNNKNNDKYKKISRVLMLVLIANLIVSIVKISLGYLFQVNSLKADGYHAITDTLANVIGLIGIKIASKPADQNHPYGYQKFETIAGFTIGLFLLIIIYNIIYGAIQSFINPQIQVIKSYTLIALGITFLINIFIVYYERKLGHRLNSDVLISDSLHTQSDLLITFGVFIVLILLKLGFPPIIDPILSILIALLIMKSSISIFKMTIGVLVDKTVVNQNEIIAIIMTAEPEVIDVHKIRSRGKMDHIYIDLHIITNPFLTVKEAHLLSHRIEDLLNKELGKTVELNAHIEPNERG